MLILLVSLQRGAKEIVNRSNVPWQLSGNNKAKFTFQDANCEVWLAGIA
jgi:hypothetical protein